MYCRPIIRVEHLSSSQRSVERMVLAERTELYRKVMGNIKLDCTEGPMNELVEEVSLERRIRMHKRGEKALDVHEPVFCSHQFENGVRLMCISTLHLLCNMARSS